MIVGLGMDLVEISRISRSIARFGDTFLDKILHESEKEHLAARAITNESVLASWLAARFAAKEAASKALGTGFAGGVTLHDIRVFSESSGKPRIELYGHALKTAEALGVSSAFLTLTHARDTAGAVVILER